MQEEAFFLHALRLSDNAASRISELAALAPQFFVEVLPDSLDPPPSPIATNSGWKWQVEAIASVLRSSGPDVRRCRKRVAESPVSGDEHTARARGDADSEAGWVHVTC